jgi:predicted Ser/Thr protein kinase
MGRRFSSYSSNESKPSSYPTITTAPVNPSNPAIVVLSPAEQNHSDSAESSTVVEQTSRSSAINDTDITQKNDEGPPIPVPGSTSTILPPRPPSNSTGQVIDVSCRELDDKYSAAHPEDVQRIPSLEFNLQLLLQIVKASLKTQALAKIELFGFGCFNKVYLFSFADGKEAVVRLPYGKKTDVRRMEVESEVVTMKYAKAKLPTQWASLVPCVYTSDPDPSNAVGVTYIVMARAAGRMLSDVWKGLEMSQKRRIVQQTVDFTSALHSVGREFTDIGSLHCKDDEFYVGPSCLDSLQDEYRGPWPTTGMYLMARINSILLKWQNIYFRRS